MIQPCGDGDELVRMLIVCDGIGFQSGSKYGVTYKLLRLCSALWHVALSPTESNQRHINGYHSSYAFKPIAGTTAASLAAPISRLGATRSISEIGMRFVSMMPARSVQLISHGAEIHNHAIAHA